MSFILNTLNLPLLFTATDKLIHWSSILNVDPLLLPSLTLSNLSDAQKAILEDYIQKDAEITSILATYKLAYPYSYIRPTYPSFSSTKSMIDNDNMETRRNITRHFYNLILDDWIYNDLSYVLDYMDVHDDLKNNKKYYNVSGDDIKKVRIIELTLLHEDDVEYILTKFVAKTGVNWIDLVNYKTEIKKLVGGFIKGEIDYYYKKQHYKKEHHHKKKSSSHKSSKKSRRKTK